MAPVTLIGLLIQISFALSAVALRPPGLSLVEGLAHALAAPALRHAPRPSTTVQRPDALAPVFTLGFVHTGRGPASPPDLISGGPGRARACSG